MKWERAIGIGVILALSSAPALWAQDHEFVTALGGKGDEQALSAAALPDKTFVAAGYTTSAGAGGQDMLLSKFDLPTKKHLWSVAVGGRGDEVIHCVITTSDGNLVATGTTTSAGEGGVDLFLAKFSPTGNRIWARTLGGGGTDEGFGLLETSDRHLVVVGDTDSISSGPRWDLLLAKFDLNGNLQWQTVAYSLARSNWGRSLVEASDRSLFVVGGTYTLGGDQDVLLARFTYEGTPEWGWRVGYRDCREEARAVARTFFGRFYVAGTSTCGELEESIVLRYDESFNEKFKKIVPSIERRHSAAYGAAAFFKDDAVVVGRYFAPDPSFEVWLSRWNPDGTLAWSRSFGGDGSEAGYGVAVGADGGLVVAGATDAFFVGPPNNVLVARCNVDGRTCLHDKGGPGSRDWNAPGTSAPLAHTDGLVAHPWSPSVTPWSAGVWATTCIRPCDLNCDQVVNNFDIDPFVLCLTSSPPKRPEYYAKYPYCDCMLADCNGDGIVNNFDIDCFVRCLVGR